MALAFRIVIVTCIFSLKLMDYDYMTVVMQELGAAVKPLGLIVKDGNLMPDNAKDKELATYCRKVYH